MYARIKLLRRAIFTPSLRLSLVKLELRDLLDLLDLRVRDRLDLRDRDFLDFLRLGDAICFICHQTERTEEMMAHMEMQVEMRGHRQVN